jgi:hypothetical protein
MWEAKREITPFARFHKGVAGRKMPPAGVLGAFQPPSTEDGSTFTPGPMVEVMAMRWT